MANGISEQIPELHKYSASLLIAYLFDLLQSNEKMVLDLVDIYLVSQIQTEQLQRYLVSGGKKRNHTPGVFFMH